MKYVNQTYVDNDNNLKTVITTLVSDVGLHAFTYNWALMDFDGHILACGHHLGNGMEMTHKQLKSFHELSVTLIDKR